ncbi:hypothetical protein [Celerinatantimonas diazotrophica]|uniref:Uncharacterized protein n=1 Tax=Celerinatantimonas diazotrophica TaxID=412034 RepID=A0A4R1J9J1_9GAMM|nr:hypothetical protein [Celerinatantimonas diazotrophica]TCK47094.1 hypothetical protein EV690_2789 [Celerinatantimonas diazotrophica]CAG9295863.1 hypothetical protein CEDIAZO_00997 [Celerinatantimonas diazotrophica]
MSSAPEPAQMSNTAQAAQELGAVDGHSLRPCEQAHRIGLKL